MWIVPRGWSESIQISGDKKIQFCLLSDCSNFFVFQIYELRFGQHICLILIHSFPGSFWCPSTSQEAYTPPLLIYSRKTKSPTISSFCFGVVFRCVRFSACSSTRFFGPLLDPVCHPPPHVADSEIYFWWEFVSWLLKLCRLRMFLW